MTGHAQGNPHRRSRPVRGLTLLEVVLSIAILGMAMVTIGELVRIGYRSAAHAQLVSEAQILCDSMMAEISAGVVPPESSSRTSFELDPRWVYSVEVQAADKPGLLRVHVLVERADAQFADDVAFSLMRFVPDPNYDPAAVEPEM
jgi:type II secretion system protein I